MCGSGGGCCLQEEGAFCSRVAGSMAAEEEAKAPAAATIAEGEAAEETTGSKGKLAASIEAKGENSYYFAHSRPREDLSEAKRVEGDGSRILASDGGPQALEKPDAWLAQEAKAAAEKEKINWREDYSWGDEDTKVKIYVEFPEGSLKDPNVRVESRFEAKNFELVVRGIPGGTQGVKNGTHELSGDIISDKCSHRVNSAKNRITVTLVKGAGDGNKDAWSSLKKKTISQHTGWN